MVIDDVAERLAGLPGVEGVTLGGSRAQGTARPDSDWDLGLYYRDGFSPQHLRDLGWEGTVSEIGDWGGGVFNGGAWLKIGGVPVDVHFRDLGSVESEIARAEKGEFGIEPLMFHLAGIPTYLVVAELAINQQLRGRVPMIGEYPPALRKAAAEQWKGRAELHLGYAEGRSGLQARGLVAVAAHEFAHAVMASRGRWATNEKRLLEQAGLSDLNTASEPALMLRDIVSSTPV
ncbi:nucleotidyltransferase domain-containing protein [Kineosporia babensis]|uniref:Nucleotidyltransferase domain-containing protein n=1 Tax=Kineosporia babensis TaxID=499548 RepID=A0A9X1NCV9_9ACTN|nr:nucleotidyltransferase domain-containing protein [Kineosporia babensis]MCD5311780.1 nucleotidyltransferase domain-containing protein [Kineosporia babensis]